MPQILLEALVKLQALIMLQILFSFKMLQLGSGFWNKFLNRIGWRPRRIGAGWSCTVGLCRKWIEQFCTHEALHPILTLLRKFSQLEKFLALCGYFAQLAAKAAASVTLEEGIRLYCTGTVVYSVYEFSHFICLNN